MAVVDAVVQVPPDSNGKMIDNSSLTVGANTVYRQRGNLSSPSDPNGHAEVRAAVPAPTDYGVVTRQAPTGLTIVPIDTNSSGALILCAAVAAKTVKLHKLYVRANGNTTLTLQDTASTNLMGAMDFAQGGDLTLPKDTDPWHVTGVGLGLQLLNSAGVQISGVAHLIQS
jgi:hypothetical protein